MNNSDMNKICEPENWDNSSFESRFFSTLMRMNRLFRQHIQQEMEHVEVSMPQMWFLSRLSEAGSPQPISFFADGIHSNRSNATQMIDRLEAENLVRRIKNPDDRRSVLVELTQHGQEQLNQANQRHEQILANLLQPLSDDERDETIKVFQRLSELINQ